VLSSKLVEIRALYLELNLAAIVTYNTTAYVITPRGKLDKHWPFVLRAGWINCMVLFCNLVVCTGPTTNVEHEYCGVTTRIM
jgi:hypothetical protein